MDVAAAQLIAQDRGSTPSKELNLNCIKGNTTALKFTSILISVLSIQDFMLFQVAEPLVRF